MIRHKLLLIGSIAAIILLSFLGYSIAGKEQERVDLSTSPVVKAEGIESKSEEWAQHYPRQYDSWKKTKNSYEIQDLLEKNPQLPVLWAGYGFAKDYNAPRGHFYALRSNQNTLRTGAPVDDKTGPMPTARQRKRSR